MIGYSHSNSAQDHSTLGGDSIYVSQDQKGIGGNLRLNGGNKSKLSRWLKFARDKKRFAWVFLSLLKNNVISAPVYYILLITEYLELIFLYLVFALIYYDQGSNNTDSSSGQSNFIQSINSKISATLNYFATEINFQIAVIVVVLFFDCLVFISIFFMASRFESPELAKKPSTDSKILCLFLRIKVKITYTFEVIILAQIFNNPSFSSPTQKVFIYAGSILCLILSGIIEFVVVPVVNIRIRLISEITWCCQKSVVSFFKSLFKLAQGVTLAVGMPQAQIIVLFLIITLYVSVYIYMQPFHNRKLYIIDITFSSILFAQYFHLLIESFNSSNQSQMQNNDNKLTGMFSGQVTLLLVFLSLLIPTFAHIISLQWRERLQNKLLEGSGHIKSEFEIEKALVLFMEQIEKVNQKAYDSGHSSSGIGSGNQQAIIQTKLIFKDMSTTLNKQIVGLILYHRERCKDFRRGNCFCLQFDDSLKANRVIQEESKSKNFETNKKQSEKKHKVNKKSNNLNQKITNKNLSSNIEEEKEREQNTMRGTNDQSEQIFEDYNSEKSSDENVKNNTRLNKARRSLHAFDTVDRKSMSMESFEGKELDWQQEEQKQFSKGLLNPLFQEEYYISQAMINQQKLQQNLMSYLPEEAQEIVNRYNQDPQILDFDTVKIQTVIQILYRIVKEYCDLYPKSVRLLLFRAYFELFIMRKKYLSHQTLTRMVGEENLGLLQYCQYQVDQQYLIEKAQTLYQTKEDLAFDVDRIIQQNFHYQQFIDLNKETATQLSNFWIQLQNPKNVDIEKLFNSGSQTSELIKLTKDKFEELQEIGIDKRNSSLYYMFANFNKYVLNSIDLFLEYTSKMQQIQNMNKSFQNNTSKDQVNSDVEKSGFLLVRGTFLEFGQIIYANRVLCKWLSYTPEQLNNSGKIINAFMPQILSEKHHLFLNIFRENGVPTFIQRQQHLFVKNAHGYINPLKCYIKFHYDKKYGHVFCLIANKIKVMHPFKNKKKMSPKQVLTILTDELGTICEISPTVTKMLGMPIKFVQQNQNFLQDNVKIWHMFKCDQKQMEHQASCELYTTLNPDFFSDSDQGQPVFAAQHAINVMLHRMQNKQQNTHNDISQLIQPENQQVDIKVKMARIRHKNVLVMRYFFIEILEFNYFTNSTRDGITRDLVFDPQNRTNFRRMKMSVTDQMNGNEQQQDSIHNEGIKYAYEGEKNSSTSSESNNKFGDMVEKDIDQLVRNDKRTPKVLKQILWMILFAFLTSITISAIITGMFLSDSQNTQNHINILIQSLQRGIYCSQVVNLLRSLIDHQIGYEPDYILNNTQIWSGMQNLPGNYNFSIDNFLSNIIIEKLGNLKSVQQDLSLGDQLNDPSLDELNVVSINSQGAKEFSKQASNVVINVIVSNIIDIVANIDLLSYVAPLNMSYMSYFDYYNQLLKNEAMLPLVKQYQILQLEKEIFFVFENYHSIIDSFNLNTSEGYLNLESSKLGENYTQRYLILSILCIGTLLVLVFLVSPVTFKIRRQKYQVLLFFLGLDEMIIKECNANSQEFESYFSAVNFLKNKGFDDDNNGIQSSEDDQDDGQLVNEAEESKSNESQELIDNEFTPSAQRLIKNSQTIPLYEMDHSQSGIFNQSNEFFTGEIQDNEFHQVSMNQKQAQKDERFRKESNPRSLNYKVSSVRNKNANQIIKRQNIVPLKSALQMNFALKSDIVNTESRLQTNEENQNRLTENHIKIADYQSFGHMESLAKLQAKGNQSITSQKNNPNIMGKTFQQDQPQNNAFSTTQKSAQQNNQNGEELQDDSNTTKQVKKKKQEKDEIQNKIKSISSKSTTSTIVLILICFLVLCGYFIGMYLFSSMSISGYQGSFQNIQTVHERSICLTKLFYSAREDMITATIADYMSGTQQGYNSTSMSQLWECMKLESQFTEIKRLQDSYIQSAIDQIKVADSSQLCDMAVQYNSYGITTELCHSIQNDILGKSQSLAHQDFIKQVLIVLLDYFSRIQNTQNVNNLIQEKVLQPPFLEYLYTNDIILSDVNAHLNQVVVSSALNRISQLMRIHLALFLTLAVVLIMIMIYFFCYLFHRMKKDMLSSYLMIAILPKWMLQQKDQVAIREFLKA